jgi:hypothetical protein
MSDQKTGVSEFIATASTLSPRRQRLIQRMAIRRMQRKGMVSEDQAEELKTKGWQDFLDWIIENGPAIMEFIMMIISMFAAI